MAGSLIEAKKENKPLFCPRSYQVWEAMGKHKPHHISTQRFPRIFQKRPLVHSLSCIPGRAPHPAPGLLESKGAVPFLLPHEPPLSPYSSGSLSCAGPHPVRLTQNLQDHSISSAKCPCHCQGTTSFQAHWHTMGCREIRRSEDIPVF